LPDLRKRRPASPASGFLLGNWLNFLRCHGQAGSVCPGGLLAWVGLPCATHRRGGAVGGRRLSGNPALGCGLGEQRCCSPGANLIAAINSIVGDIGLAAADCPNRDPGGQRCSPGRYHRPHGCVRAASAVAPASHQPRTADEQSRRDPRRSRRPARRSELLEQVLAGCRWTLVGHQRLVFA
jgi:hypothetical protein